MLRTHDTCSGHDIKKARTTRSISTRPIPDFSLNCHPLNHRVDQGGSGVRVRTNWKRPLALAAVSLSRSTLRKSRDRAPSRSGSYPPRESKRERHSWRGNQAEYLAPRAIPPSP